MAVSVGLAAALHVGIFLVNPTVQVESVEEGAPPPMPLRLLLPPAEDVRLDTAPGPLADSLALVVVGFPRAQRALLAAWPEAYRAVGEGGIVTMRLTLDTRGRVVGTELLEGTGDLAKDAAFRQVAETLRYMLVPGGIADASGVLIQRMRVEGLAATTPP